MGRKKNEKYIKLNDMQQCALGVVMSGNFLTIGTDTSNKTAIVMSIDKPALIDGLKQLGANDEMRELLTDVVIDLQNGK